MLKYSVSQSTGDNFLVTILEDSDYKGVIVNIVDLKFQADGTLDFEIELPKNKTDLFNDEKFKDEISIIVGDVVKKSIEELYKTQENITKLEETIGKKLDDLGIKRTCSDLTDWAKEGILLLNSIMTVEKDKPLSHKDKGWEIFTDKVISLLQEKRENIVFLLWGAYACKKVALIDANRHCVLTGVHPSPLSAYRGFFGCKHFSKANEYLISVGKTPIEW